MKIILLELNNVIFTPIAPDQSFGPLQNPEFIPYAKNAMLAFQMRGYFLFGIGNDDWLAGGLRSPELSRQIYLNGLTLAGSLTKILMADDFEGVKCTCYGGLQTELIRQTNVNVYGSFRLPDPGLVNFVIDTYEVNCSDCWIIGSHPMYEEAAKRAKVNFCPAKAWLDCHRPGIHTNELTLQQILFLEKIQNL